MSTENQDFEALRKLLALKKHEQPPPGYYDQLSSEVMARLRSGEHERKDWWGELGDEASWLQRILGLFEAKPALAGAFGMLVCGLVITGVFYSQKSEETSAGSAASMAANGGLPVAAGSLALSHPDSSTNAPALNALPSTMPGGSLFDMIGIEGQVKPVSFEVGGK